MTSSSFICAISGESTEQPVVSPRSGEVFDKRLIMKFIAENGCDPITKESLEVTDLVELKQSSSRPSHRSMANASLPSLLKTLQDEWDAVMLNSFVLQQELKTAREELTHALYQNDAACRVISRLSAELKAARAILANFPHGRSGVESGGGGAESGGTPSGAATLEDEEMPEADAARGIPEAVLQALIDKANDLSAKRKSKGKSLPEGLAGVNELKGYGETACYTGIHSASTPGITALDLEGEFALTGGMDKTVVLFNVRKGMEEATFKGHQKRITSVVLHPDKKTFVSSAADSQVRIWALGEEKARHVSKVHAKSVSCLSLHPTGDYMLCTSEDAHWSLLDLKFGRTLTKVKSTNDEASLYCGHFQPDGLLFGTGGSSSVVKIWDMKEQQNVAQFPGHQGPVHSISFSENGYYVATGADGGEVKIWDLRKLKNLKSIDFDTNSKINCLTFDSSGAYLAVGSHNVEVLQVKTWSPVVRFGNNSQAIVSGVRFGENASSVISTSSDKSLRVYSKQ